MSFVSPSFSLAGKVAIVTGGNRGIGRSIALGLGSAGAAVAIFARDPAHNAAMLAELEQAGVKAMALAVDVTKRDTLAPAVAEVEATLGPVDILVNNAGNIDVSRGVLSQSEAGWDNAITTHLDSTFLLSKIAATSMVTRGRGKIINLASMYSIFGASMLPSYGAVK